LPLLVLATLFFYPLLLIAEQALRDTSGHLGLETFWQVMESRRFIGALLNTLQIAVSPPLAAWCSAACWR
jgi:2-aminoethylphosphonate transport system permease protein